MNGCVAGSPNRERLFCPADSWMNMDRRRFLSRAVTAATLGLAGCAGQPTQSTGPRTESTTPPTTHSSPTQGQPPSSGQVDLPVPESELEFGGPPDGITPIIDPAFASDWSEFSDQAESGDTALSDAVQVIGVERDGAARAYPLSVLSLHEIVNDTFEDPLLVTYCPLCASGVVAERRVAGGETLFGNSGYTWQNDLVMYDFATESLWSQLMATAIRGPQTGDSLTLVPSSITTWGEWQRVHPDTAVLLPPPASKVKEPPEGDGIYDVSYYISRRPYRGREHPDREVSQYTLVLGIASETAVTAYPYPIVNDADVINDTVGSRPVVVATAPGETMVGYDRRVDGTVLQFFPESDRLFRAGGSTWERTTGRARDGPHAGTTLDRAATEPPMFLRGWRDFHPDTTIYGSD